MQILELKPLQLVETPTGEVLKVSTIYRPTYVTAEVVYPIPARTTVRGYTPDEVLEWHDPRPRTLARYEEAWARA